MLLPARELTTGGADEFRSSTSAAALDAVGADDQAATQARNSRITRRLRNDEGVFERFTPPARQVIVLAQEEARSLNHNCIGTEHILLGLIREDEGLAARVLESLDITVERVRAELAGAVGSGEEVTFGQTPFTARGKKVLELTLGEALSLGHNYIDTEHILLGLVGLDEGLAARILRELHVNSQTIRDELFRRIPAARHGSRGQPRRWRALRAFP